VRTLRQVLDQAVPGKLPQVVAGRTGVPTKIARERRRCGRSVAAEALQDGLPAGWANALSMPRLVISVGDGSTASFSIDESIVHTSLCNSLEPRESTV
jgi:hypothetical protein